VKALITAGGYGTRLRPITHTQNKHLIPIANKIMLAYALDYIREAGIIEVGIVVNVGDNSIRNVFNTGREQGLRISYIEQSAPKGLAHVVKISEDFIKEESFVFYLGDNILVGGIKQFIEKFNSNKSNCHLVLSEVPDPNRFGVAEVLDDKIISIAEKPERPKSDLAVTGIYLYDSNIFQAVNSIKPSERGELEISDAHQYLLENNYSVTYSEITGWWKDTGKPSDLLEANRLVLDNIKDSRKAEVDEKSNISGRVQLGAGTKIVNSTIRGPAILGNDVLIENAYIGPYSSIGNKCIINGSELEYSIIMESSKIDNVKNRIEGSLIGNDVIVSASNRKPKSHRFILGDQSRIEIE